MFSVLVVNSVKNSGRKDPA